MADEQWRSEVAAQLNLLTERQTQLAELAALQVNDQERQRPDWLTWVLTVLLLALSAMAVRGGVLLQIGSPLEATASSSLATQGKSAVAKGDKADQPITNQEKLYGTAWATHAIKVGIMNADMSDIKSSEHWFAIGSKDANKASADESVSWRWGEIGPLLLAFGSALCGAILGWMLTLFVRVARWSNKVVVITRGPEIL